MKITKTQLKQLIKEELSGLTEEDHYIEKSQYEEGSAGYHMERAINLARDIVELEKDMPNATGLGFMIEEELVKALDVMDNTIDYYESLLSDLRADDD